MSVYRPDYPILQRLAHKARGNLLVKFHPSKTLFDSERPRLFDTISASHVAVKDTFERRNKDHLHWHITANVSASDIPFAVVRNKLKRRYISAFCSALKEKGYQTNGKVLSRDKTSLGQKHMPQRDLRGTLELCIFHKVAHEVSFERMRQDAKLVIDAVCLKQSPIPRPQVQSQVQVQPQFRPWEFGEILLNQGKRKNQTGPLIRRVQLA